MGLSYQDKCQAGCVPGVEGRILYYAGGEVSKEHPDLMLITDPIAAWFLNYFIVRKGKSPENADEIWSSVEWDLWETMLGAYNKAQQEQLEKLKSENK